MASTEVLVNKISLCIVLYLVKDRMVFGKIVMSETCVELSLKTLFGLAKY